MCKELKILLVEDNEDDAIILVMYLEKEKYKITWTRVDTLEDLDEKLNTEEWDLLISDFSLAGFTGREVLQRFKQHNIDIPFLLVSGAIGDETASELMRLGVQDFILKGKLHRLVPAIEREMTEMVIRANNKLYAEQLRKAKIIIDNSPVVLWEAVLQQDFEVTFCSDNVTQYGHFPENFATLRKMFEHMINPEDKRALYKDMRAFFNSSKVTYTREFRIICKDGTVKWLSTYFRKISDKTDTVQRIQGINIDITDRKQSEQEIIKAKEKAEESDRFKTALIGNMSHELHTPMNGILGFTNLLRQTNTNPEDAEMLDSIMLSAQRLLTTLNSVMTIAKLESGYKLKETDLASYNLSLELDNLGSEISEKYAGKKLGFKRKIEQGLYIKAEAKLIRTAISNVMDNAFKFTNEGEVSLSLSALTYESNPVAEITISDTGMGVSKENLAAIFSDFQQISEGYSRSHEGLGLGLSITDKILKLHKGNITAQSTPQVGSSFVINLPLISV